MVRPSPNLSSLYRALGRVAKTRVSQLSYAHPRNRSTDRQRLDLRPSEYFRRQGAAAFDDDAVGLRNLGVTGADCLMWGNDYPHDEGTFPHSRDVIERIFKGVPAEAKRKIVGGNAARLYRFPL